MKEGQRVQVVWADSPLEAGIDRGILRRSGEPFVTLAAGQAIVTTTGMNLGEAVEALMSVLESYPNARVVALAVESRHSARRFSATTTLVAAVAHG